LKKISVDLDENTVEKINRIAKKKYRSFGAQVRQILDDYPEENSE